MINESFESLFYCFPWLEEKIDLYNFEDKVHKGKGRTLFVVYV
jgi:hypothetical protein